MILGIVDSSVVGIYQSLGTPALLTERIDIAFMIIAIRKNTFVIAKLISADTFARSIILKRASAPSKLLSFLLRYEILRTYIYGCCLRIDRGT